jgi:hypothetical protein
LGREVAYAVECSCEAGVSERAWQLSGDWNLEEGKIRGNRTKANGTRDRSLSEPTRLLGTLALTRSLVRSLAVRLQGGKGVRKRGEGFSLSESHTFTRNNWLSRENSRSLEIRD